MYETVREIHSLAYCKHYLLEDTMLKLHPKKLREAKYHNDTNFLKQSD